MGPSLDHHGRSGRTDGWGDMEKPLVSMISRLIRAKASVPHAIIRAELAAPPLVVEALTRSVSFIHRLWDLPRDRYARLALLSTISYAGRYSMLVWGDDHHGFSYMGSA